MAVAKFRSRRLAIDITGTRVTGVAPPGSAFRLFSEGGEPLPRVRGRPSAAPRSTMDVYDVDLLPYYWRGGTFFERFAMRRE